MKIAYSHLVTKIKENPGIEQISEKLFQLGHEHEIENNILNMEFTPNRGDCLSINGLLRDLAAFYTIIPDRDVYNKNIDELSINFENLSKNICPRISFLEIEVDQIPKEYKGPLNSYFSDLSLNKNNFFTDVSNYLSYETGQPTHCFDANKINGKLVFQEIQSNEDFETLLDKKITITQKNPVFLLNNDVISLAGVVGGKSTSCSSETKKVIVECAFFQPESIIGKSLKYKIQSEASHKFERHVDPECQERVLRRFIKIVSENAIIKKVSMICNEYKEHLPVRIPIDVSKINKIIGINISENEYLNYLSKLGFIFDKDFIKVPSFRGDITSQNDLAEEVARIIGYNNIVRSEISIPNNNSLKNINFEKKLKFFLLDHGFYEVINSPFVSFAEESSIKVDNPLDSKREFLRTNITNSLIDNLMFNERRQKDSIKLFEISDIYISNKTIDKKRKLSIIASGRVGLNHEEFSQKINKKYLSNLFQEMFPDKFFNFQIISRDKLDTKVTNEIVTLEIDLDEISNSAIIYNELSKSPKHYNQYRAISDLPSSLRDLSFSVSDASKIQKVISCLSLFNSEKLKNSFMFDYYENKKDKVTKIGYRFIFQSNNKTLTDEEIDEDIRVIMASVLSIDSVFLPGVPSK